MRLLFLQDGGLHAVTRPKSEIPGFSTRGLNEATTAAQVEAIAYALAAGPTPAEKIAGAEGILPEGTTLDSVVMVTSASVRFNFDIPADGLTSSSFNQTALSLISDSYIDALFDLGIRDFYFAAKDPATGEYRAMRDFLPAAPKPEIIPQSRQSEQGIIPEAPAAAALSEITPRSLPTQNGFVAGALSGRRVVLNASHGWYDNSRWAIQRSRVWELLEDFDSPMFMNYYVIPLLENAGAQVRPVREPDSQTNMVIVDNAMAAPAYVETGSGWFNSGLKAFVNKAIYQGLQNDTLGNPFANSSASRLMPSSSAVTPTASATFTPQISASGYYNVYITYAAGGDRATNAHYAVYHSGGVTDFRIDQTRTGGTWVLLGNFYFEQGAPSTQAKVVVSNDQTNNSYVNVDAVRFGGGMGNVARRNHGVSGRPRWQEDACNYLQFNGMMSSTWMNLDTTTTLNDMELGFGNRPQSANWEQVRDSLGDNLIYIGWHTNANSNGACTNGADTDSKARGTSAYRDVDTDATANTEILTQKVYDAMIASIKTSYAPGWSARGIVGSNGYGEANQAHLGTVSGFFFEGLFHDGKSDSGAYKDGKFRYAAARGIVNGIIQYYKGSTFPPEPVTNFRVKNIGSNKVRIEWNRGLVGNTTNRLGSAATNFRLFTSSNGYGFDNGVDVGNVTSYDLTLTPGELVFLRVSGVNTGGIAVPSETLAARVGSAGAPTTLIVNGYHRDDQFVAPLVYSSGIGGCAAPVSYYREMDPRKYQALNYTIQHATAIAAKGNFGIDSSSDDAINIAQYNLQSYPMVFWIGGQEAEADTADNVDDTSLRPAIRTALSGYLENGGNLFISGSEIAWDLGRPGAATDKLAFFNNYLKARFYNDDANTYTASTSGLFGGLGNIFFDNGTAGIYDVRFPDVILSNGGSLPCMSYGGGSAAVQYAGNFGTSTTPGKLIYMGFGFETITTPTNRNNVMSRAIDFFTPAGVDNWKAFQ